MLKVIICFEAHLYMMLYNEFEKIPNVINKSNNKTGVQGWISSAMCWDISLNWVEESHKQWNLLKLIDVDRRKAKKSVEKYREW